VAIAEEDDGCAPATALQAAARLQQRQVSVVVGHPCPGAAMAVAKAYAAAGVTFIAPATTHPRLTGARAGPTIFRLSGRSDAEGAVAASFLADRFAGRRVAIISDRSAYGQSLAEAARRGLAARGVKDVITGHVTPAQKDYGVLIAGLAGTAVKAIVYGGFPTEAFVLADGLKGAGVDAPILLGEAGGDPAAMLAGRAAAQGLLVLLKPDPAAFGEAARALALRLRERGEPATLAALSAYAAVQVTRAAASAAARDDDRVDGKAIASAVAGGAFETVLGTIRFDDRGDARMPSYAVHAWRGNAFEQIWIPKGSP
jgi:branched-chain amino acid transport system substrate-binding protein